MDREVLNIVHWRCKRNNWGDAIAPFIAEQISGQTTRWFHGEDISTNDVRYTVTGSINQWLRNDNTIIWGTGFISQISKLHINPIEITAVRGPLTRQKFIDFGKSCPEIYGDPALLMPRYYSPSVKKKYSIGIIPHYVDVNHPWLTQFRNNPDVKIINVCNSPQEMKTHRFINEVCSCETIFSSSLHGVIAGDAYNIPSYYIKLSDKVVGNGYKFRDYFMSVQRPEREPIEVNSDSSLKSLLSKVDSYELDIDLDKLLNACPFSQ